MAKARHNKIDFDFEEEEYDEETEYLIDDVIYYIEEDMPRKQVLKHLEKCNYDIDETVNRIFQIRENKEKKKLKRQEMQLKKKEEQKKLQKEEKVVKGDHVIKGDSKGKIPWPSTNKGKEVQEEGSGKKKRKRDSVNIESKRKESKKLLSNFKIDNNDKTYWNISYPIIEYPE